MVRHQDVSADRNVMFFVSADAERHKGIVDSRVCKDWQTFPSIERHKIEWPGALKEVYSGRTRRKRIHAMKMLAVSNKRARAFDKNHANASTVNRREKDCPMDSPNGRACESKRVGYKRLSVVATALCRRFHLQRLDRARRLQQKPGSPCCSPVAPRVCGKLTGGWHNNTTRNPSGGLELEVQAGADRVADVVLAAEVGVVVEVGVPVRSDLAESLAAEKTASRSGELVV